jgi:hypothetical protein
MVIYRPHITKTYERWRIRDPSEFYPNSFRIHDIGRVGYSKRIAGILKKNRKWATQSLLISHAEPPYMKARLRAEAKDMIRRARGIYLRRRKR